MVMKKTSDGDSPLWQGVGKSFWTLPILGQRWLRIAMCFWKIERVFRFSHRGVFIGKGAASEVDQGALTIGRHGQALGRAPGGETTPWLGSVSSSVFWKLRLISRCSAFVSSNFENISCVTFLKHKNSRKQGTGTVASC
jgi:hypothetical protein